MFAAAYSIAREFTRPVIISFKQHDGNCKSIIGAFVLLNEEGWFLTCNHIVAQIMQLDQAQQAYNQLDSQRKSIHGNPALKDHEKQKQLKQLKASADNITNYSVWWGEDAHVVDSFFILPEADLAVGQLKNFDSSKVKDYPKLKDPSKDMPLGTSLCKLGFPFHNITPSFDSATNQFLLPPGSVPPPLFPLEGIYTRCAGVAGGAPRPYAVLYLETSSPGIPGQSGGPTFDVHGTVWAIQSQTSSLKLGFGGNIQGNTKEKEHLENQFLHVGLGVHAETIIGFLTENNIKFQLSAY